MDDLLSMTKEQHKNMKLTDIWWSRASGEQLGQMELKFDSLEKSEMFVDQYVKNHVDVE